jgi:hypothetical protein
VAVRGLNRGGWSAKSKGAGVMAPALFVANVAIAAGGGGQVADQIELRFLEKPTAGPQLNLR